MAFRPYDRRGVAPCARTRAAALEHASRRPLRVRWRRDRQPHVHPEPGRRRLGEHKLEPRRPVRADALRRTARHGQPQPARPQAPRRRDGRPRGHDEPLLPAHLPGDCCRRRGGPAAAGPLATCVLRSRPAVRIHAVPLLARRDAPLPVVVCCGAARRVPRPADDRGRSALRRQRTRPPSVGIRQIALHARAVRGDRVDGPLLRVLYGILLAVAAVVAAAARGRWTILLSGFAAVVAIATVVLATSRPRSPIRHGTEPTRLQSAGQPTSRSSSG